MFLADCHTHSVCSPDSEIPMVQMAQKAVEYGLTHLTLTDHCDLLSIEGVPTPNYDWAPVLQERKSMLDAFGTRIDLPMGVELGMGFLFPEAARTILSQPGLDFVIGSAHNLSQEAGGRDFFLLDYTTLEDCYQALDNYFQSMLALAAAPEFYDVVGHIIYPLRYMKGEYPEAPSTHRYRDEIFEICRRAAEAGKGIEINTWKGQTLEPWIPVLKLFKEAGGEIVTVGSDAHAPAPVGRGIKEAYQIMQDCGFRYAAVYHERKPDMFRL
ncbi:MAG: histidinol-phosphatase HisJ family protein [Bacillota bacterium]|nr:histidinol-phosphatase HisJ family protein [Bacillota bacterium]